MSNPPRTAGQRPRVLLAEDDAALRRALTFSLSIEGYDVEAVGCGQELLDLAVEGSFAFVIDQNLPDLTGLECLARLRERRAAAPAVLITAAPSHTLAAQAGALGATVLLKPILGDALIAALGHVRRTDSPG